MTRWASTTPVSDDEESGEREEWGECSNCLHRGLVGTQCPMCEETGFIHESRVERQRWQDRLDQEQLASGTWRQRVNWRIRQLVRVGRAGSQLPLVGQGCLVLRGDEQKDLGQEAVITKRTAARIQISYRDSTGRQATRLKHPSSLILLEDGLHVSQDANGSVWIKRETRVV
jgi:hypothetical protein